MDFKKMLLSGLKFFVVAVVGVVIAALTMATTGFTPGNPLEIVVWQYLVGPALIGVVGLLQNFLKHYKD